MSELYFDKEDIFNFQPSCIAILRNYKGSLFNQDHDLPHPGAMVNTSWKRFLNSVDEFFDALELGEQNQSKAANSLGEAVTKYEAIMYRGTELIETLLTNVKKSVLPIDKWSDWKPNVIKKWRNHPTVICNKIKHNHNLLVGVEGEYQNGKVIGYAVCYYSGDALKPNKYFHKKHEAFAFGADLRKIFAHIYLISDAVFKQLSEISPESIPKEKNKDKNEREDKILKKVSALMPQCFHDYRQSDNAVFDFDNKKLKISDSGKNLFPIGYALNFKSIFSGDGHTKSFHIFYYKTPLLTKNIA